MFSANVIKPNPQIPPVEHSVASDECGTQAPIWHSFKHQYHNDCAENPTDSTESTHTHPDETRHL